MYHYYEGRTIQYYSLNLESELGLTYHQVTTNDVIVRDGEIVVRDEHYFTINEEDLFINSYTTDYYIAVPRETYEKHPIKYIQFEGFSEWIEINETIELDLHH